MKRRTAIAVAVVALLVLAPVAGALLNAATVSGTVTLQSDSGTTVKVSGASQMRLDSQFPDADTVEIETDTANATFESGGDVSATAAVGELEGTWTNVTALNVTAAELRIDPNDKPQAVISGDADSFSFKGSTSADDGVVDFVYAGASGTTTVTIRTAPANTQLAAVDQNGNLLDVATSDGSGVVTFSGMPNSQHNVELVTTDGAPQLGNPQPTGNLSTEPAEVSIDVSDTDFPTGDNVTVTFDVDGSQISSQTTASNGTVTASLPSSAKTGGQHDVEVTATDAYGQSATETFTYTIPSTLFIRNESNPSELVNSPTNVTLRFFADEQVYSRETSTGSVNLTGLPVDETFIVDVEASANYSTRTVYLKNIYEQNSVYLLPDNESSIETRFTLDDPTGEFDSRTILYVEKAINRSGNVEFRTVHADRFGVEGVTTTLAEGERYRTKIESPDGTVQDTGPYRADVSETVTIQPGSPTIELGNYTAGWDFGATIDNTTIEFRYDDPENETTEVNIYVHEKNNASNILGTNRTFSDLGEAQGTYSLTVNQSDLAWVVNFEIVRGGETIETQRIVTNNPSLVPDLSREWRLIFAIVLMLISAGIFSMLNASVGGVVVAIEGGFLWWTGWLTGATTGAAVVMGLFVAILYHIYSSSTY